MLELVSVGVVLALYLCQVRARTFFTPAYLHNPSTFLRDFAVAIHSDIVYVTLLGAIFGSAAMLLRNRPGHLRILRFILAAAVVLSVIVATFNVIAVVKLGRPLTYQWLYYSDFLLSLDANNALRALISWRRLLWAVTKGALVLLVGLGLARLLRPVASGPVARPLAIAAGASLGLFLLAASFLDGRTRLDRNKLANPVTYFIASAFATDEHPLLSRAPTRYGAEDFLPVGERPAPQGTGVAAGRGGSPIRNVVVFVMESVPAKYLGSYGGPPGITPVLDRVGQDAVRFTNMYAHVPSTVHSLVTLLLSVYNPLSFRLLTRESPAIGLPSLSGELKRLGFRTAFFNGSDNRFQRGDEFLDHRGFDLLRDYRSIPCSGDVLVASSEYWPLSDGTRDRCAVAALLEWVKPAAPAPFFALFWTMQTHYPYFAVDSELRVAPENPDLNRYLSALKESDRALGDLLDGLDRQGLLDATLVVVLGDHGEAFGEHSHWNHHLLYEEDLHVPFLLINAPRFHGQIDSTVGGIIDVAPTILDLLGHAPPPGWQGRSLFERDRTGRVYFFSPYSDVFFGYREGSRKLIYGAGTGVAQLYDLESDPGESVDLAAQNPEEVRTRRERLAAWVQYQARFYRDVKARQDSAHCCGGDGSKDH
jgi:phosphoglycerol transferase MdoB-like AlkP superfamily enzyme